MKILNDVKTTSTPALARRRHVAAACTGATFAVGMLGAVAALFDDASRAPWLAPMADNVAAVQRCDGQPRGRRDACVAAVIAAVASRHDGQRPDVVLAQHGAAPSAH